MIITSPGPLFNHSLPVLVIYKKLPPPVYMHAARSNMMSEASTGATIVSLQKHNFCLHCKKYAWLDNGLITRDVYCGSTTIQYNNSFL